MRWLGALVLALLLLSACGSDGAAGRRTIFMGDSITAGGGFEKGVEPNEYSWLRYALQADDVPWSLGSNVAVSGQTLSQMAARFRADVLEAAPSDVVIMGGTNDVLQTVPRTETTTALRQMIEDARAAGIRVWVIAPPPSNLRTEDLVVLRAVEQRIAEEEGAIWLDPTPAVSTDDGKWQDGLTGDGVHPLPVAAEVLGEEIARLAAEQAGTSVAPSPATQ
jgi:lysophospholipase L1-like esterase